MPKKATKFVPWMPTDDGGDELRVSSSVPRTGTQPEASADQHVAAESGADAAADAKGSAPPSAAAAFSQEDADISNCFVGVPKHLQLRPDVTAAPGCRVCALQRLKDECAALDDA